MMKNLIFILFLFFVSPVIAQQQNTQNLIIITTDGYQWQELFRGADSGKLFGEKFTSQSRDWRIEKYWDDDLQDRRKKLMPFFWNYIAQHGQLYGNRDLGNFVNVKNQYWFSYPGYNEMFTGYPDPKINTNSYPPNPNVNVLEFINKQSGFKGKVAVFASWNAYYRILNEERSGLKINAGWTKFEGDHLNSTLQMLNFQQLHLMPKPFGTTERLDAATYPLAKEYLKEEHPRVLYIALIDTDARGHRGQYDYYLDAAHAVDAIVADIWKTIQSDPFYKDKTTLFITTDHGRGYGDQWTSHGSGAAHSDEIWFAVMGPDTKPLGEIKNSMQLYQNQFAKTIAAFLGLNFTGKHPIGETITMVIK